MSELSGSGWHDGADSLYLASLVLPVIGNDGQDLLGVHETLASALLDTFGGFTSSDASGLWRDDSDGTVYSDTLVRYDVALSWEQRHSFLSLVKRTGRAAGQHSVYATFNGIAKIIPCGTPERAGVLMVTGAGASAGVRSTS